MTAAPKYLGKDALVRCASFREAVDTASSMRDVTASSSLPRRGGDDVFYEYDGFLEACAAFVQGVDGPRDVIESLRESVRRRVGSMDLAAFRFENAIVGNYLDLDSFLGGEVDCMMTALEDLERRRDRFVRIIVDNSFSSGVKVHEIRTRGAAIVALCDVLNLAGYSTEVWVASASRSRRTDRTMALLVPVQRLGDPWDIRSAAFPLCSGDFSRRLKFAVTEGLEPEWSRDFLSNGYGVPMPTTKGSTVDLEVGGADVIVQTGVGSIAEIVRDPFAWIMRQCHNLGVITDEEMKG